MYVALVQLALTAVLGPAPSPGTVGGQLALRELASTYDQATCATIHGGDADDWDRAAIGEDAPAVAPVNDCPIAPPRPAPIAADCNDPLASRWLGEMIGTCDMPRGSAVRPNGLRAAHPRDPRAQRLLVELATSNDGAAPFVPLAPDREASPAVLAARPRLPTPPPSGLVAHRDATPWRSVGREPLLRPPRS